MADERRSGHINVENKVDELIGLMKTHFSNETERLSQIEGKMEKYFGELDAHIHKYHHEFLGDEIELRKENHEWWKKIRGGITEKLIVFVLGAFMSYLGAVMWIDFADKINKTPIVQVVPKANPNVQNQP